MDEPRRLVKDESIIVVGEQRSANGELPVAPAVIGEVLRVGHHILIDDGLVRLVVEEVDKGADPLSCPGRRRGQVAQGREPARRDAAHPLADEKDLADLDWTARDVDYVALVRPEGGRRRDLRASYPRGSPGPDRQDREARGDRRHSARSSPGRTGSWWRGATSASR